MFSDAALPAVNYYLLYVFLDFFSFLCTLFITAATQISLCRREDAGIEPRTVATSVADPG
jgi:hypothetical protein